MILFTVSQNINIKTTDGTLINYFKYKEESLENKTIYISTKDDFEDLKQVFINVNEEKYKSKLFDELSIRKLASFPIELGESNSFEDMKENSFLENLREKDIFNKYNEFNLESYLETTGKYSLPIQLKKFNENEVKIAIIGSIGKSITEMINYSSALRIFFNILKKKYSKIEMDVYINASNNTFFTRDKEIFANQDFISNVLPLSLSVKKLCEYDFFLDTSSVIKKSHNYNELNNIDFSLKKLAIDYKSISDDEKYGLINLANFKGNKELVKKIDSLKKKGKILLFHPYSANKYKSMPHDVASEFLKKLILKLKDYTIISTLAINPKIKDDRYVDLSKYSKSFSDYSYIVSSMDKVISVDTSAYYISDSFMIPSIVISSDSNIKEQIKYLKYVKCFKIKDKSKKLSKFIFKNDDLTFYKSLAWEDIKINKIIKLLDSF